VSRPRILPLVLAGAIALCLFGLRAARPQSAGLRRVTNTSEEGININPSISGDGRIIAFESTEDVAHAGGADHFRAIRADLTADPATLFQIGGTRAVAPAISQDGTRIAFASKDDPLGANPDGNSEIFLLDGAKLIQLTNTSPGNVASRVTNGNFQPSISDDGRFVAFSSNRDLAAQNADGNLQIFVYDVLANSFTQLTDSSGMIGFTDAKISGNGGTVAYIRDAGTSPGLQRDLLAQPRAGLGPVTLLASNVQALAMTYGRAISDDGTRVVYSAETATSSTQVFLFDGRSGSANRQITSLGARATEVPLHPTISGDGSRLAFAARRSVSGTTANSDGSVELYAFDIPSSQISKVTDVPSGVTADVVSSLNDDGSIVAFNFPRILSGTVSNSDSANNSEIYVTATPPRPPFGTIKVLNGASFGKEPSLTKAVAPDSIAVATGVALANSTEQPQRLPNGTFPTNVRGTTVTVNGRAAQILFVSPGQVNFVVPAQTEIGTVDVMITNSENFTSRGTVPTLRAAPGVFSQSGDGEGQGVILNSDTLQEGPFDPGNGNLRLSIFATGARNASQTSVVIGGRVVEAEIVIASPDMPGLDEVHVLVPRDLRGAGTVDLFVQSDGRASNPVAVTVTGDGTRDVLINEALVDPADGVAGDANRDGTRDPSDDEFIELVNTTAHDIDLSGYQLLTRSSTTTTDTIRHTFAAGTILPACSAIVVFGGGTFDPGNPLFGGSQAVKASSGGLSLINTGGVITLRDQAKAIITSLTYGGTTGLNGDANQSLTRSPDKTGNFVLHQAAGDSGGRSFSPGTQVSGSAFALCNPFVRIDVSPSSTTVDAGAKQQFTARTVNANGDDVPGVIFSWRSSNASVATVDQNGLATTFTAGSTEIRASAHGTESNPAALTVREIPRVLTLIEVAPQSATIPATGAQQFTAKGVDQFGNEMAGLTFAWESSNTNSATIDQSGLASGISQGQSTIKATSQNVSGTTTLNVTAATIVVNEVLADPPTGTEGDANHDGIRDSAQDEFVELVNSTSGGFNLSGWTIRTHSTASSTETVRHTFVAGTTLPAEEAMVVFGGGTFNAADPLFGCAQVVKASSGSLSLTNGGLTILVRDGSGNLVTQFSYGGSTGLNGGNAQSLTRSPDINGPFVLHTTPTNAVGRKFSPGLRVDGTPFGSCAILTVNDVTSNEGDSGATTFTFTVNLSTPAPPGGVTFDIATQDSTATVANDDYVSRGLTGQTIAAGQQTYSFDVTVNGDLNIEPNEAFFVNVTNISGAIVADSQGMGTILNDDSPALSINDVSVTEGNSGTTTFTFTVSSTLAAPAGGITFDIATADGTATSSGSDYVARSLTGQTIAAGETSYTFDVSVNGDTLVEPAETFFVNLKNVSGANLADGQGVGTILNDDTPLVDISQLYGGGGNTGATYENDFIEIFNRGNTTVDLTGWSVQYTSAAGTGTWSVTPLCPSGPCLLLPGRHFLVQEAQGAGGNTTLPTPDAIGTTAMTTAAGKVALSASTTPLSGACPTSASIVDMLGYGSSATCFEGTGPAAAPGNTTSVFRRSGGCIDTNDNAADSLISAPFPRNTISPANNCAAGIPPNLTVDDVTVTEGNTGTITATFTVSLSTPAPSTDVTFDLATQNNTATTANNDYVAKSLTGQVIPAGQQTSTFSVTINGDTAIEPDETFFVNVTNVSGATVLDGQGVGTIHNDDLPMLSVNDVLANEGNAGTRTFSFTVSLSAPAPSVVSFDIATQDNSATVAASDYVSRSLTGQTIAAGNTSFTFDVTVNGDTNIETDETFFVNVTNVSGAAIVDGQGLGTIQNDDSPALSINDVTVTEGNSGTTTATFTVTLSPSSSQTVTVGYATSSASPATAAAGTDYQAIPATTLTFNPGDTSKTTDVLVNGDVTNEAICETFFVNLTTPVNATISDSQGQGGITDDDGMKLVISQVYGGGGNSGAPYTNDFIEIFNRGNVSVNLSGMSVQYAAATGTTWQVTSLSGTLGPGKYYLIQESSGGANGTQLPTPNASGTIAMAAGAGKVALVSTTVALAGSCPSGVNIIDFAGYGTTASCFEGGGPAPAPSATASDLRRASGCIDAASNANDFATGPPNPRNTATSSNTCSCSSSYSSWFSIRDESWKSTLAMMSPRSSLRISLSIVQSP
jgi:uncharacterized protein (TIGR03437 family)